MTIGGAQVPGLSTYPVIDPAIEGEMGAAPSCSPAELDQAVAAAQRAFPDWAQDEAGRRAALRAAAQRVASMASDIAAVLTAEQGKPLKAALAEVNVFAGSLRWYAALETDPQVIHDDADGRIELRRRPIGPVAAITPWNFPLALAGYKLAPALLAGNTVVLKPAPSTPLSTLLLGALVAELVPPGVLNVVSGPEPLGSRLAHHRGIRKVSFTGSVASGKKVARAAADDLKRVTLELGGNDAAILLDDVEVAQTVRAMFWSAFENNGQTCLAIKRVYAPRRLYADVVAAFADYASKVRVRDGRDAEAQLGPVHSAAQLERVMMLLADALSRGARVVAGGRRIGERGFFHQPTIVADAEDGMPLVDDEQFGPVLPIIAYDDERAAVTAANATHFGLGASVWSADPGRATVVADGIESGTVWINAHLRLHDAQPFGGVKWSGIGLEHGRAGYDAFTDLQVRHTVRG
jgi:acyl-CoA reductase-like NAD-dependent aldehyde dehydrogenase